MIYVALVLFILLNFTDFVVTTLAIQRLGFEVEGNQLLRSAMEATHSIWPMFVAKVANSSFALLTFYVAKDYPRGVTLYTWLLFGVSATLAYAIYLGILILKDL